MQHSYLRLTSIQQKNRHSYFYQVLTRTFHPASKMVEKCYVRDCDDEVDGHILLGEGRLDILVPVCNKHCFTARNLIDLLKSTIDGVQRLTDLPIVERWTPTDLIRPCIPSSLTNRNLRALTEMLQCKTYSNIFNRYIFTLR